MTPIMTPFMRKQCMDFFSELVEWSQKKDSYSIDDILKELGVTEQQLKVMTGGDNCISPIGCLESNSYSKRVDDKKRTPEAIRGCCNTCSTLAVGGGIVCGRVPHWVCKSACFLFIETIRQICEGCCYNGGYDEKCWTKFSFWKDDFHYRNPNCSHPNDWL